MGEAHSASPDVRKKTAIGLDDVLWLHGAERGSLSDLSPVALIGVSTDHPFFLCMRLP